MTIIEKQADGIGVNGTEPRGSSGDLKALIQQRVAQFSAELDRMVTERQQIAQRDVQLVAGIEQRRGAIAALGELGALLEGGEDGD